MDCIDRLQMIFSRSWKLSEYEEQLVDVLKECRTILEPITASGHADKWLRIADRAQRIV